MRIGVPKETAEASAASRSCPRSSSKLTAARSLERRSSQRGAGAGALIPDAQFEEAGAGWSTTPRWQADVVVKVAPPNAEEIGAAGLRTVLIGFLAPLTNGDGVRAIAADGARRVCLEAIPRISRAQSMDALSTGEHRAATARR